MGRGLVVFGDWLQRSISCWVLDSHLVDTVTRQLRGARLSMEHKLDALYEPAEVPAIFAYVPARTIEVAGEVEAQILQAATAIASIAPTAAEIQSNILAKEPKGVSLRLF
eukprot:GHVU01090482.1.p6 GENE.GHVU01090482.1~~GHVU01090482.1.p6  ORF type:complete len:110 (+),score=14.59 GHVU01090482.1:403-732(+)